MRPTGALAASGTWAGWMQCTLTTTGSNSYSDVQTQTWRLTAGAARTLADATTAVYPATWSVTGSGGLDKSLGIGPGSPPEGDHDYFAWDVNAIGIPAPLAIGLRTSDARITFSSAHPRFGPWGRPRRSWNYGSQQASTGQATFVEMPLPVVTDTATSVRVAGSSTPVVSGFSAPMQPADARTTASCSWLFDRQSSADCRCAASAAQAENTDATAKHRSKAHRPAEGEGPLAERIRRLGDEHRAHGRLGSQTGCG